MNPLNPAGSNEPIYQAGSVEPNQNKRRNPSPSPSVPSPEEIQPLKKSAVKSLNLDPSKISPLCLLLFEKNDHLNFARKNDHTLTVSNVVKGSYTLTLLPAQETILFDDPSILPADEFLNAMIVSIPATGPKNEIFNLTLMSLLFENCQFADKLALLAKEHVKNSNVPFVAEAAAFIHKPYHIAIAPFVNPRYAYYTCCFGKYLITINGSAVFPVGDCITNNFKINLDKDTPVFFEPSSHTNLIWNNCKSFALLEALIAKNKGEYTFPETAHIKNIRALQEHCQLNVSAKGITLVYNGFNLSFAGEIRVLDSAIVNLIVQKLQNPAIAPKQIDTPEIFLAELFGDSHSEFIKKSTITSQNPYTVKTQGISCTITKQDTEILPAAVQAASPAIPKKAVMNEWTKGFLLIIGRQLFPVEPRTISAAGKNQDGDHIYKIEFHNYETASIYIRPSQLNVLTNLNDMTLRQIYDAFKSPISCTIKDVSFYFSLFSLFLSNDGFVKYIISILLTKFPAEAELRIRFLVNAARYGLEPLLSNYINPEYRLMAEVYLDNLKKLNEKENVLYDGALTRPPLQENLRPVQVSTGFTFTLFPIQEATYVLNQQHIDKNLTGYLTLWAHARKTDPDQVVENNRWSRSEKSTGSDAYTIKTDINNDIPAAIRQRFLPHCIWRNLSVILGNSNSSNHSISYTSKGYEVICGETTFVLNQTQFDIVFRQTTLPNNSKYIIQALTSVINLYKLNSNEPYAQSSLLSLLFLNTPATQSLIAHLNKFTNSLFSDSVVVTAVRFALLPYVTAGVYVNPEYAELIAIFKNNLIKLTGKNQFLPSHEFNGSMQTGHVTWNLIQTSLPATVVPNLYQQEASACLALAAKGAPKIDTPHIRQWKLFLSRINDYDASANTLSFKYKGKGYVFNRCAANTDIFREIIAEPSTPATAPAAAIQPLQIHIDDAKARAFLPSLLRPFKIDPSFTYFIEIRQPGYAIKIHSQNERYELIVSESILKILLDKDFKDVNAQDFLDGFSVHHTRGKNSVVHINSLFALFYDNSPQLEQLKSILKGKCRGIFFASAAQYATQPFSGNLTIYLNPELLSLTQVYHKHLLDLNNGDDNFPSFKNDSHPIQTGEVSWKFRVEKYKADQKFINPYVDEMRDASRQLYQTGDSLTEHVEKWNRFYRRVTQCTVAANHSHYFWYKGQHHQLDLLASARSPLFIEIVSSADAPQAVQPAHFDMKTHERFQERAKALLYPFAEGQISTEEINNGLIVNTSSTSYWLHISPIQMQILLGNIPPNLEIASITDEIQIHKFFNNKYEPFGSTCLLALFYENNEYTTQLLNAIKPLTTEYFIAQAVKFALAPFHFQATGAYYARPDMLLKTATFHAHLSDLSLQSRWPYAIDAPEANFIIADASWQLRRANFYIPPVYNLATVEQTACMSLQINEKYSSLHIDKWRKFYRNAALINVNTVSLKVKYRNQAVEFKGAAISRDPLFNRIVEGIPLAQSDNTAEPQAQPVAALPPPLPESAIPAAAYSNPLVEYAQIGNAIEKYWLQNPVNYSRWIRLLQESKAVFSFEELPKELMEPLKKFNKEHVAAILSYFGVSPFTFEGDLPDELVDKAVPTLLRVKAAEFNLYRKSGFQAREFREIEYKPCYLVKPGPRFVHIIKVTAQFDAYGFLTGFILNGKEPVEKNISLEEYSRIEEDVKEKKVIVLQRETVKLTEEAPQEALPPRPKRAREETADKKEEIEREPKEAKAEPILPPVPQARVLKRTAAPADGTVHPHAPKESKFKDRSDISTDKPRAIGKPSEGGIIPPPELIEQPLAPAMQEALSLDDLFSALSANAIAQVNHVVKKGINYYKAIFAEEPLAYEGLELIRKLKDTPLPTTPCLVPKAKKYQWEFALEAKRRENAGLGTILAPYMGLGKTWIYFSKIVLALYENAKGHHIVITPNPLRKTIYDDAVVILNNARLNAFIHLKSIKWGDWCASQIIKATTRSEKEFLLSLLGLFNEEEFNKIMMGRGPFINELCINFVGDKFQQYPSKIKRVYEYCKIIAPKDLPERGRFDEKGLERILTFSSSRIKKCDNGNELTNHAKDDESLIIIASYEQGEHLADKPVCAPGCASVIFDEAQYIHNPKIKIAISSEKILKALNPKSKIAVTGTPIENGVEDLFQLVGLMAPELKCPTILSTISSLSISASRYLKSKQPDLALSHLLKLHGHLQAYLTVISQNLVLILQREDQRVKDAWGEGATVQNVVENITLSAVAKQKYEKAHELFKTRKADPVTREKLDSNMAYYSRVAAIMLDTDLQAGSLTAKDPNVQRLLKWIKAENDMTRIDEFVARSAILSAILYTPQTNNAHANKDVTLIFVANIAIGKVVRKILKKKYPEPQTESYLMYGTQKEEKKNKIISKLQEVGKPKFGILSIESGSAGFSIPKAALTLMLTLSYNVATEMQALARMVRATSTGHKNVVYFRFGLFSEEHIPVVQEIKKLIFKNFFTPASTQLERLKDMARFIRNDIYQSYLNEKRDAALAKAEMKELDEEIINDLLNDIEEDELVEFVNRLTPALPAPVPQPAKITAVAKTTLVPPLRIPGNKLFKVPLPNTLSNEDKVRLAAFISKNRKSLDAPIKEIYHAFKDANLRNFVRSGAEMPTPESARAYQTLLNLIKDAKADVPTINDVGIDLFKIEGQEYVLEEKQKPELQKRVKVVKGMNDVLEILI